MLKIFSVIILFLTANVIYPQSEIVYKGEIINRLDNNNNKTGIWKLYDDVNAIQINYTVNDNGRITTEYFKSGVTIALYDSELLKIFQDNKTILAKFHYKNDSSTTLLDVNGNELESSTLKFFYNNSTLAAQYYGGLPELYKFISENINRDNINKATGKVVVKFTIDKNGFPVDVTVTYSSNDSLNEEAVRIIKLLPRWQPGFQAGGFVNVMFTLPIIFG